MRISWSIETSSSALRQVIEKYRVLHGWHKLNFAFSREMIRLGLSAMNISVKTSGLPHRSSDEIPFFPTKQSLRVVARLLTKPYVTVHHGFDLLFLPAKTRTTDYGSTKNISIQQWHKIVSLIRAEGIDVIQLGMAEEEKIEGVTHYLNGQTSLEETGLLIKHGLCHIDTEGGLVHLANAVHTRCVVLFGPHAGRIFWLSTEHQSGTVGLQGVLVRHVKLAHRVSPAYQRSGMHEWALRDQRSRCCENGSSRSWKISPRS